MKFDDIESVIEDKYKKVTRELLECINNFIRTQYFYVWHNVFLELDSISNSRHTYLIAEIGNFKIKIKVAKKSLEYNFSIGSGPQEISIENRLHLDEIAVDEKWCSVRLILIKNLLKIMKDNSE